MYQNNPYQPPPPWTPSRRWWQHPALVVTLLVIFPPGGIALAWLSRWTTRTKIVATVLSGLWFLIPFAVDDPEQNGTDAPKPAATVTAPATPSSAPTTSEPGPTTEAPTPDPTPTTVAPTPEPTTAPPRTSAPKPARTRTPAPEPTTEEPEPVRTTEEAPTDVHYANCTAVRAAGAAPIHRGEPGYDSHLDRDGDGVACER
ncbi:excalibur calcium-binding domain-containing protein [Streptomyces litmocidini]|uniref:excalibur calcium-binding domain-containing protein n=1 Tax=Streptomyces litmocidini TaxID=67318 RepID=UPI0036F8C9AD